MPRRTPCAAPSPDHGRMAALATKHDKQRALVLPFRCGAGLSLRVPEALDTDLLGTFTGEIERTGTPGEVVRRKARLIMEEIVAHKTNYARKECAALHEVVAFANRAGFPSHGLIVRPEGNADTAMIRNRLRLWT